MPRPERPARRPDLPPAGHARDEVLRQRADTLEAEAADRFGTTGAIDPAAFKEDHDAQVALRKAGVIRSEAPRDGNEVDDAEPGYVYCWAREDKPGEQVRWKLAKKVTMPDGSMASLWEIVCGDMPEAKAMRDVRGYRKMVDCILLRARADRHRAYQIEIATLTRQREQGTSEGMQELADRSRGQIRVYSEADVSQKTTLDRAMAQGMARTQFTKKLREGTAHHI